jgi:hypothetical protein
MVEEPPPKRPPPPNVFKLDAGAGAAAMATMKPKSRECNVDL